jgi:hypothetical protein
VRPASCRRMGTRAVGATGRLNPAGAGATPAWTSSSTYWLPPAGMERCATEAGFETVFTGGVPAEGPDNSAQGHLLTRRPAATASTETSAQAGITQTGTVSSGLSAAGIQSPVV